MDSGKFIVDITEEEWKKKKISHLQELIKNAKKNAFEKIDACELNIWKVVIHTKQVNGDFDEKMKILMSRPHMKINIKEELDGLYLSAEDNIKEYIDENPSDNHIHTIVKPPPPATTAKTTNEKKAPLKRGISVIQSNNEVQQVPVSESIICRQNVLVNSTSSLADDNENKYGQVIILIDEYDSPLLNVISITKESIKIANDSHGVLKSFFEVIKALQSKVKFLLVTGITMFAHLGLFPGLNNLKDVRQTIKSPNQIAIMIFFENFEYENFWIQKGKTEFLARLIGKEHVIDQITIEKRLVVPDLPVSLLFQTGYLTIKQQKIDDDDE
ncbi:6363_t:CDS:2, partial [Funneliformis caledonium]